MPERSPPASEPPVDGAEAVCPRCGAAFHCGVEDAAPCACTTVALDAATLAALRDRYDGCLCLACLQSVARGDEIDAPAQPGRLGGIARLLGA